MVQAVQITLQFSKRVFVFVNLTSKQDGITSNEFLKLYDSQKLFTASSHPIYRNSYGIRKYIHMTILEAGLGNTSV